MLSTIAVSFVSAPFNYLRNGAILYKHALCVYPYRRDTSDLGLFPPLGLELIAAVLEPRSQSVEVVDFRRTSRCTAGCCRPETDLVCFSINWKRDTEYIRDEIRAVPPGKFVLLGGRHVSESVDEWFAACPNVTAIVRGDGEDAVEELARGDPLEAIAGMSFRKEDRIIHNANRDPGPLRDDLIPARNLRSRPYQIGLKGVESGITVDMISASRGCPFNCNFCSFNRNPWGKKRPWSARTPESVVNEIAGLEATVIGFTDDLFTWNMDWVEKICDLLLERGIRKKFVINARIDVAKHPAILAKMEKAGFALLMLGIESVTDKTLRAMKKGFDTARIRESFDVLRRTKLFLHGFFILGCIGETLEEMRRIGPFASEVGIDTMALSTLRSSPFSGLDELVAQTPGYHIAPNGKIYSDQFSIADIKALRRTMYREFYSFRRILHIIHRGIQCGALRLLPRVLPRLPRLVWNSAKGNRDRSRRRTRKTAEVAAAKA